MAVEAKAVINGRAIFANLNKHGDFTPADAEAAAEAAKLFDITIQAAELRAGITKSAAGSATRAPLTHGYKPMGSRPAATEQAVAPAAQQKAVEPKLPQGPNLDLKAGLNIDLPKSRL